MNFLNYSTPCVVIALSAWTFSSALSAPSLANVPASGQALKFSEDPVLNELNSLLKQGDLSRFYEVVRPYVGQHSLMSSEETLAGDKLDRQLLIDRLAAAAPLFELNEDTPIEKLRQDCVYEHDINLKEGVMNDLFVISKINLKRNRPLELKRETAHLCSLYAAIIIRTMKDSYIPHIAEKNREIKKRKGDIWRKAFFATWKDFIEEEKETPANGKPLLEPKSKEEKARYQERVEKGEQFEIESRLEGDKRRNLSNMLGVMEGRNSSIGSFLQRRRKALLLILLDSYPGKSSEVLKYLKLAGYEEDEMMEVVDQAVGRNKQTEFLYKSSLGRTFLKKKEEQAQKGKRLE